MPNDDLDLSVSFNLDDYIQQATKADEVLDGIGKKAEETAQKVSAATAEMGSAWEGQNQKEQQSVQDTSRVTQKATQETIDSKKKETAAIEAENEKQIKSEERLAAKRKELGPMSSWGQPLGSRGRGSSAEREEEPITTRGQRMTLHGLRTASILSGIRDSRSIDAFLGGFGGVAGIAGVGGALAVGATVNVIRNAAKQAEDLKKLSDAMGISITQAGKLSFAANLAGEDMDTMASASRKLADALENPGTTGKKTAEALIELGVSLREGMGAAFQDAAQKLIALKDPTQQAALGAKIFGQQWKGVLEAFRELPNVGQNIDTNLNERLVEANRSLKDFGNTWTIWKGEAAGAILSVGSELQKLANFAQMGQLIGTALFQVVTGTKSTIKKPFQAATGPQQLLGNPQRLKALLGDSSKTSLQEQLEAAKAKQANAEVLAAGDSKRGASQSIYNEDYSKVTAARKEVERLEAAIKAADKAAKNAENLPELLAKWHDRAAGLSEPSAIAKLDEQYKKDTRQYGLKPFSSSWSNITADYGLLRSDLVKKQQDQLAKQALDLSEAKDRMDRAMNADSSKSQFDLVKATSDPTNPLFNLGAPMPVLQAPAMLSARNQASINRTVARGATELNQAMNPFADSSQVAKQNLELKLQEVEATRQLAIEEAKALEPAKQQAEVEKANTEATVQRYQTIIEYEKQIAEVRKQQLQETKSFATGFFNAAISGQPGAGGNFLRSWGRGMADKIVGNAAAGTIGTMESHLTLQRNQDAPGLLSNGKGNLTFMGKLLQGTPFGLDPAGAKLDPKMLATDKNTNALDGLTAEVSALITAIGQAAGIDTSSLGGNKGVSLSGLPKGNAAANLVVSVAGKGAGIARSIAGGNITGGISQAGNLLSRFTTPKFVGESPVFGGSTAGAGNIDLSPFVGALAAAGGGYTPPKGSYDPTAAMAADPNGLRGVLQDLGVVGPSQGSQDANASIGIMGKLGNILNGTKYVTSGQAPGVIMGGGVSTQNPDGTWTIDYPGAGQRWGAGLGLAASTIGGGMAAYGGFSKGGARGDIQGIAGTAAAVAPFTGPAAPFIEGGAALMGLISSLFPDPRQQRIKQQQKTLLGNAYLQPASRDYNFSSGDNSEGFSYGMGGSIRAGGPTANTNITIQAMDASSFVSWGQNNPQAMAQAMLFGLSNGSNSAIEAQIAWTAAHQGFFG